MVAGKFVTYFRVSTQRQGQSGLGLEAQKETVANYLKGSDCEVIAEFQEVETGKGSNALVKRPQLALALALCKKTGARLLIAKLDRLARNVHFISGLMESKIKFVACDLPEANELTLHVLSAFAEFETKRISERTRDSLRAAKARGVVLGAAGPINLKPNIEARQKAADEYALSLAPVINGFRAQNMSQRKMVEALNKLGIRAPRGGLFVKTQLVQVLRRLDGLALAARLLQTGSPTPPNRPPGSTPEYF
ncbi:DNA invertase Pin-like site-specific DNA recombinase [Paraburkholderia sp. GAS38]|uniref:recombinase family protein n=1 Tax=Paraburkholderia sp. GAS38 TaxID=3035133 RepID=UPI003D1DD4C6